MAKNNPTPDHGEEIQIKAKKQIKVDYKNKIHPVLSVCTKGDRMEQLNSASGVTVDSKTSNIYISDHSNNCVKVFDDSGKYLFKFGFGDSDQQMVLPRNLVICGDCVFVSDGNFLDQSNRCISIFQLNGYFVTKIRIFVKSFHKLSITCGLACDESNGDIYICDSVNNCILILYREPPFKYQFGADRLKHPLDVKLSKEYIYILNMSNPCIHLYDYNLILQKSVVSRGRGMQVDYAFYFFIDDSNNILISDGGSNSIHIFNSKFELIHKINTSSSPLGVAVDIQGRVIVVCGANKECLQIF